MPNRSRMAAFTVLSALLGAASPGAAQGPQPGSSPLAQPPERVVARVNGQSVRLADVKRAFNRILPMQSFHGSVDEAKVHDIARQAMQAAIDRALALQDARARGIEVSEAEIDEALAKVRARYPGKGALEARMKKVGLSMEALRALLAEDALAEKIEALVARRDETVSLEEARAYYQANLARFQEPVRAEVRQIMLKMPPTGRSEALWAEKEAEARKLAERARAGEDFAVLARQYSEAPEPQKEKGGLLGAFHKGQLAKYLDAVVWRLEPGEVSDPVRSFYGVHVVKVDRLLPARQVPFEEIAEKLRGYLQKERAKERLARWREGLRAKASIEYLDPYFAPQEEPAKPS